MDAFSLRANADDDDSRSIQRRNSMVSVASSYVSNVSPSSEVRHRGGSQAGQTRPSPLRHQAAQAAQQPAQKQTTDSAAATQHKPHRTRQKKRRNSLHNTAPDVSEAGRYAATLRTAVDLFEQCYTDMSLWTGKSESKGITCYVGADGDLPSARGDGVIPFPLPHVVSVLTDLTVKPEIDNQFHSGHRVAAIHEQSNIDYLRFKNVGFVSGRDFVNLGYWWVEPDGTFKVVATGVDHPDAPSPSGVVRGRLAMGGWVLKPIDGGARTHATYVVKTDLCGSIPGWST